MGVNALDAAGFGGSGPTIGEAAELDIPAMTLAMTGFVGLPLLLLAAAGTAVSAPLRAHRLALLRALGVPARQRRRLVVLEAAVAFLPGLAIGGLAWVLGSRWITTIPVVGRPVAEGALTPPRWSIALVLLILAVAFAVLAVVTERRRREDRHAATPRPRAGRPRMAALRAAPALSAIALLAAAAVREGELAATTTLAGVVLLAAGVPLALPLLARAVGDRMARTTSAPAQVLAGRRLQYDPRSAVRPLYGIAALLVITPVVASWITAVRDIDPPAPSDPAAEAMLLRGALGHTDFDALLQGLPDAIAAPMTLTEPGPGSPPGLELGATCPDIGRLLDRPACTSTGDLRPDAEHRLSVLAASPGTVTLVPPEAEFDQLTAESSVLVITPRDPQAESDLRAAALAQPAALTVLSEADRQLKESELVSWILGGIALFSALVFLLLATGLIDRSADGRRGTRLLTALGLTRRRIRNINGQEFLLGYAVVAGTGLAAGIVASLAWSNLDPALSYPFGITMLLAVAAAALAGVGLLGIRLTDREDAPLSG